MWPRCEYRHHLLSCLTKRHHADGHYILVQAWSSFSWNRQWRLHVNMADLCLDPQGTLRSTSFCQVTHSLLSVWQGRHTAVQCHMLCMLACFWTHILPSMVPHFVFLPKIRLPFTWYSWSLPTTAKGIISCWAHTCKHMLKCTKSIICPTISFQVMLRLLPFAWTNWRSTFYVFTSEQQQTFGDKEKKGLY